MKIGFIAILAFFLLLVACTQGTVGGSLQIQTKELPNWVSGGTASFKVLVTGGTPPYSFKISGSLPNGFTLGPDGTISGGGTLPSGTSKKVYPAFTLVVTDKNGTSVEQSLAITIVEPGIKINAQTATCTVKQKCDEVIATAEGGDSPYTFQSDSFAEGAPPMGMIVDVNGHITGTPSKEGEYTVGVCAKDTNGNSKCGHATVIVQSSSIDGTWVGPYSEEEYVSGGEGVDPCTNSNSGTMTWTITSTGSSFSGNLRDDGSVTSSTCEGSVGGSYDFEGTVEGDVSGSTISGKVLSYGGGSSFDLPFAGTISGDTITGTYTGTGTFDEGPGTTYNGNFNLKKQ